MALRMLINAQHREECRIAVANDDQLLELEVERADQIQLKGNIYKAPITRIEPSLQAAFLDIGSTRNGFLQINDINSTYFANWPPAESEGKVSRPPIQDVLRPGQDLVVQVVKDERAMKGATLTTNLSIPGRYLVLMVGNQRGGVSRKIVDESQRTRLRGAVRDLRIPPGMGVIVRTAGINKSTSQLQADLNALLETWFDVVEKAQAANTPQVLYQESDLATRTIRDYLTSEIDEILIDDQQTFENAIQFVRRAIPQFESRIKLYDQPQPLFTAFHLDSQIEQTDCHEVTLPSGGSIVINSTEAVVAIDVNSGRSTGQSDVEETAFATNKEAAVEVARQLRLRDLGGLVVIDFIDMSDRRHKQTVEKVLRDAVSTDKAKVEIGRISKFGLLEMSRQRLKSSLVSQSHSVCPHCLGRGRVKTSESAALEALRKIQSAAFAGGVEQIRVHMSPSAALLLLNEKRHILTDFELRSNTKISIYADGRLKPEEYKFELITERTHSNDVALSSEVSRLRSKESPAQRSRPSRTSDDSSSNRGNRRRGRGKSNNNSGRNRNSSNRRNRKKGASPGKDRRSSQGGRGEGASEQRSTEQRNTEQRGSTEKRDSEKRSSEKRSNEARGGSDSSSSGNQSPRSSAKPSTSATE